MLETVVLSILNHDSGVASVGSRMVTAARGRGCIEMGGRRVHEDAAIAAARAAYLVGFASTSNLAAGAHYRVPVAGTSAHAFTLLFDSEEDAFRAQLATQGAGTTVLVDTYDVESAVRTAVEIAGPALGAVRLDSGDLAAQAVQVRALLDSLGATSTRVTATGDLDEYRVEELKDAPLDGYGIGTRLVTGGGHPAPGFVYKLVEREGADGAMHPVGKRSTDKATLGAGKAAYRMVVGDRARAELVLPGEAEVAEFERELTAELISGPANPDWARTKLRPLQIPLIAGGEDLAPQRAPARLEAARERHAASLAELGLSADDGPDGEIAIPTLTDGAEAARILR
jgi:nicotinate phosphoribosyltransferase